MFIIRPIVFIVLVFMIMSLLGGRGGGGVVAAWISWQFLLDTNWPYLRETYKFIINYWNMIFFPIYFMVLI